MAVDLKKVMIKMGFTEDQLPKDDTTDTEEVIAKRLNDTLKVSFKNDRAFKDEIKAELEPQVLGRVTGEVYRKLKTGLDLPIELKADTKFEEVLESAKVKLTSAGTKTVQDLQTEYLAEKQKLTGQIETLTATLDTEKKGFETKQRLGDFNTNVVRQQMQKHKLTAPVDALFPYVTGKLKEAYDFVEVEGKVTLNIKGKEGSRPTDGHKLLSDAEVVDKILTEEKLIVAKKVIKGGDDVVIEGNHDGTKTVKYESEAVQKIREQAANKTGGGDA